MVTGEMAELEERYRQADQMAQQVQQRKLTGAASYANCTLVP